MQRIIEEEVEDSRANGNLGNFETTALAAQTFHENSMQTISSSPNRLSSPFDLNRLDDPKAYEGNMNRSVDLDINSNEKTCNQLNESRRIQKTDSSQINNDQVTLLSQSVLQDHNYTSWEGPKSYPEDATSNTKRKAFVAQPKKPSTLLRASQRNNAFTVMPFQNPAVAKKVVLVKIPGVNRSITPSPAKYIKITATPRRNLNIPPIYVRTPSNESAKKVLFRNINSNYGLPANSSEENVVAQMAPKKTAVPIVVAPENIVNDVNPKKQRNKRTSKVQSDNEKVIKRPKKRGKRNVSQETNESIEKAACGRKKRGKNKLKPNEVDLSWVENLKFVRVIEKDEICPNMSSTDAFWQNLDYPPDWDDGIYLM